MAQLKNELLELEPEPEPEPEQEPEQKPEQKPEQEQEQEPEQEMFSRSKNSFAPKSAPGSSNLNLNLLNLVTKRLDMQANLFQEVMGLQEKMYQNHQEDHNRFHRLATELAALSEMFQEILADWNQKLMQHDDQIAALIRLHRERSM